MRLVWPPTTGTPKACAAARMPASTSSSCVPSPANSTSTTASGRPPIASTSLTLTITAQKPANHGSRATKPGSMPSAAIKV
jgi:hypothetical protein